MKRIVTLLLFAALLTSISCGGTGNHAETDDITTSDTPVKPDPGYVYPQLDLGEREFTILNTAQNYNFYTTLDIEEQTGDPVDDAIFNRNRFLEDTFNMKIVIDESYQLDKASEALRKTIIAGEDVYDVAFLRDFWLSGLISDGGLADLQDYDGFRFSEAWWDSEATEISRLGDKRKILYAYTDASLADFEGTLVTFFNEKYLGDLGLDAPYQLVRDGKWTFDRFADYMKAGTNLNGDENFKYSENGNAKYGMTSWDQGEIALIFGADLSIFEDNDGQPVISIKSEKFIDMAQKVIRLCSTDGEYYWGSGNNTHYEKVFKDGRALLMLAQLKATNGYRDMEQSYGIVPVPKADEKQENYRDLRTYCYVMCVPAISGTIDETAAVMDAMSFLSYRDVMPPFYYGRVSHKALRDEDSIEMLELIRGSRCIDIGIPYGWSDPIRAKIRSAVNDKSTDIVSQFESIIPSVEAKIDSTMEFLNN